MGAVEAADWSVVAMEIDEGVYTKATCSTVSQSAQPLKMFTRWCWIVVLFDGV